MLDTRKTYEVRSVNQTEPRRLDLVGVMKLLDLLVSVILSAIFIIVGFSLILISVFRTEKKRHAGIIELYISIIDFRESVLSTQIDDILVDGLIKKAFCCHFDFDKLRDEEVKLSENIRLKVISVHPENSFTRFGFRKSMACLVQFRAFFEMLKTAGREGVNIIRAQDPHLLGFNAFLLSRILKVPFMVQVCSNYEVKDRAAKGITFRPFLFKSIERAFERFIMRSSDLILTDREHYREFGLIPRDIGDDKYVNMGFFADVVHDKETEKRIDLRRELGISPDKKILLYVGRLCPVKHPLDLIKIVSEVIKIRNDAILVVVGDGESKDEMKKLVDEFGVGSHVLFPGKMPHGKLADLYNTADVVCFTSAGFTLIEAALAAKPIVVYDFEWHSEFIGNNENGVLVPMGDTAKFAVEVARLLSDDALGKRYGAAARTHALKHYSRAVSVKKEREAYERIFKKRGYTVEEVL